jgi:hypothetical protein
MNPSFERYIGIDYSGAQTPSSSLKGLRVYVADRTVAPQEVQPPASPRKYWTRKGVAEWLVERLSEGTPILVGIDHGFSFPLQYFEKHNLPLDWPSFLDDFRHHWPTDEDIYVDVVRDGGSGNGAARSGNSRWRRLAELRARTAKSVFQFDMQGSVAKSTHAGIPWLRYIRQRIKDRVHFWPFDGWNVPLGRSVVAEVYPSLWNRTFPNEGRTPDQQDAFAIAKWMQVQGSDGGQEAYFHPNIESQERQKAEIEGWILGVLYSSLLIQPELQFPHTLPSTNSSATCVRLSMMVSSSLLATARNSSVSRIPMWFRSH